MSYQLRTQVPDVPTGAFLPDIWCVVKPVARTNEVLNPSAETNTTGYTAGTGTLTRSTEQQYHGAYSFKYVPGAGLTDGFFYGTITTTLAQIRAIHCKFRGVAGVPYAVTLATTGGVDLVVKPFVATGKWQWIILYHTEVSSTTRRIYFRKNSSTSVGAFYVDGVQSEVIQAGETASTYLDGDQLGLVPNQNPVAYYWTGTPHASMSTRSALTRAGGMVIPFARYGFLLLAMVGLGMAAVQNVDTQYARIDGAYDDYTRFPPRQFTLAGKIQASTYAELRRNRGGLSQLLSRDLVAQEQRLLLLRYVPDDFGQPATDMMRSYVKYVSGLGGSTNNEFMESVPITFTQYIPTILSDVESGASLNVQTSIASNANGILQRSPEGVWSSMGAVTGGFGAISVARGQNGLVYIGGDFTPAPAANIASWNPLTSAFSAMGTGAAGGIVYQVAILPNGNLVAVGTFTSMGGVANTNKIALWNGSAWTSISSGFAGTDLRCAIVGANGVLYVGGAVGTINGVAVNNVAQWDGTTWTSVGVGIPAVPVTALLSVGSTLYAAGENSGIYRYVSSWTNIGATSGGTGDPNALAADSRGFIYAAGNFTTIGGVSANNIAYYNGAAWFPLGTGLSGATNTRAMTFDKKGLLYVGFSGTTAGGITVPNKSAIWNGSTWVYPDIIPGGTTTILQGLSVANGQFYLGMIDNGTAIGPGITTVTNGGTADAYPTVILKGPSSGTSRIYSLFNGTTGRSLWFNLTINAGETITMTFNPDNLSFISDFQGDVASSILGGSNEADFFLQPGANTIALLSANSTVTAVMTWRNSFATMDDIP